MSDGWWWRMNPDMLNEQKELEGRGGKRQGRYIERGIYKWRDFND